MVSSKIIRIGLVVIFTFTFVFGSIFLLVSLPTDEEAIYNRISIRSDTEFQSIALTKNWQGSGTPSSPYLITGLNLTAPTGSLIDIRNTTVYFVIEGNSLINGSYGIFLSNVSNPLIQGNIISGATTNGIYAKNVESGQIFDNVVSKTKKVGVWVEDSPYLNISNNLVERTGQDAISIHSKSNYCTIQSNVVNYSGHYGIYATESRGTTISQNTVFESAYAGIEVGRSPRYVITNNSIIRNQFAHSIAASDSPYTTIIFNDVEGIGTQGITVRYSPHTLVMCNNVSNNLYGTSLSFSHNTTVEANFFERNNFGIYVTSQSNNCTIVRNNVSQNSGGISLLETNDCLIYQNFVKDSFQLGLFLEESSNNSIYMNNFIDNNPSDTLGTSQGLDRLNSGLANNISYNFWNDWTSPDIDLDEIVDTPYILSGDSNNSDPFPWVTLVIYYPFTTNLE